MCGLANSLYRAPPAASRLCMLPVLTLNRRSLALGSSACRFILTGRQNLRPIASASSGRVKSAMAAPQLDPDYRANVGICLFRKGLVWVGKRVHPQGDPPRWQMPQGGIDDGEEPAVAARRELQEETGVVTASILAETDDWLHYTFPEGHGNQRPESLRKYKGQAQKWFLMRFEGREEEIRLSLHQQEFSEYAWWPFEEVNKQIVDFKLPVYEIVRQKFEHLILDFPEA